MTDREKKQQRIELYVDIEDAESNLASLRERAFRKADELDRLAKKLRENSRLEPSRDDFDVTFEVKHRLTPEEIGTFRNSADGIVLVIEELRQERQKIYHLRERSAALTR